MASPNKTPSQPVEDSSTANVPMSTYVPREVEACVKEDAEADERSESYIIAKILKQHYAKRTRSMKLAASQPQQRRAA